MNVCGKNKLLFPWPSTNKITSYSTWKKYELLIQVVKEIFQDIHIQIYEIVTLKTGKKIWKEFQSSQAWYESRETSLWDTKLPKPNLGSEFVTSSQKYLNSPYTLDKEIIPFRQKSTILFLLPSSSTLPIYSLKVKFSPEKSWAHL